MLLHEPLHTTALRTVEKALRLADLCPGAYAFVMYGCWDTSQRIEVLATRSAGTGACIICWHYVYMTFLTDLPAGQRTRSWSRRPSAMRWEADGFGVHFFRVLSLCVETLGARTHPASLILKRALYFLAALVA